MCRILVNNVLLSFIICWFVFSITPISEKIFTSWKRSCACGVLKNKPKGINKIKPVAKAKMVFLFILISVLTFTIIKIVRRRGTTTLAVLNVYIDKTNEVIENKRNTNEEAFLEEVDIALKNRKTPNTIKKVATFASNAARERLMCQGETAKIAAVISAIENCFKSGNIFLTLNI